MTIVTSKMIDQALLLARPTVELLLKQPENTWGPQYVSGWIRAPGLEFDHPFVIGRATLWDPAWGAERDFSAVAKRKMNLADRLGRDTSNIIATEPWQLQPGEFLYSGGIHCRGISIGTSGAMGWVDEAISNIIKSIIVMLAQLETDRRKAAHAMMI